MDPARLLSSLACVCMASLACTPQNDEAEGSGDAVAKTDGAPDEGAEAPVPANASGADDDGAGGGDESGAPLPGEEAGPLEDEAGAADTSAGPSAPTEPQEPEGYGQFVITEGAPTPEDLPLYALAGYEVVGVYSKPAKDSTKLGFLRVGTRMRVGEAVKADDCPSGWHQLESGGYACASRGLVVNERDPYMAYKPAQADMDAPFPYKWAYVRKWNTPMWWRAPNAEEYRATADKRAILESERTGEPLPGEEPAPSPAPPAASDDDGGEDGEALPAPDGEVDPPAPEPADVEPDPDPDPPADAEPEPEPEPEPIKLPLSPSHAWLEKGYFLSVGEDMREDGRKYWRTARGGVVEKSNAFPYEPKDFAGQELLEGMSFPVGFVMVKNGTKLLELRDDDKLHATGKTLEKRTFLNLGEEVEIAGRTYFTVLPIPEPPPEAGDEAGDEAGEAPAAPEAGEPEPALLVKADVIRQPDLQPIPDGLDPWDRWIDVDITKQMLVAYEGSRPAYVTLVSTGKKGSDEEPFETPTGRYRIYSKQVTSNMDGATATDGNYAIQDVPWVMYFEGSYALHGAFWHRSFGYVRSHGCVNLGPSDARWLFGWTTPFLPEGWYGVRTSDDNPGSTVSIRASKPASD